MNAKDSATMEGNMHHWEDRFANLIGEWNAVFKIFHDYVLELLQKRRARMNEWYRSKGILNPYADIYGSLG